MKQKILTSFLVCLLTFSFGFISHSYADGFFEKIFHFPTEREIEDAKKEALEFNKKLNALKMGEGVVHTQYEKIVPNETLFYTATSGVFLAAVGASVALINRVAPTAASSVIKKIGLGCVATGLSIAGASVGALGIVIMNPSTADGSEIGAVLNGRYNLEDLYETKLAYQMHPENLYLQREEIDSQIFYQKYKIAMIRDFVLNGPYPYEVRMDSEKLLRPLKDYVALLNKEEKIISEQINELEKRHLEENAQMDQFQEAFRAMRTEENRTLIEFLTEESLLSGEQNWDVIIQDLYEGKTQPWLKQMLELPSIT